FTPFFFFNDILTTDLYTLSLHDALPILFSRAEENLSGNLMRFREIEQLYQQAIDLHKKKLLETKGNEIHIPALKLKKTVPLETVDRKSTRLNSSHVAISYAVFCLKKKIK